MAPSCTADELAAAAGRDRVEYLLGMIGQPRVIDFGKEGLKQGAADREPKDGAIVLREWLNYATEQVPKMQGAEMLAALRGRGLGLAFVEGEENIKEPEKRSVQTPRVFYRREIEPVPLIIARPQTIPSKN